MTNVSKDDLDRLLRAAQTELVVLRDQLRDRGWKFYQRPLILGGVLLFAAYYYVYLPPIDKAARVASDLTAAQATAKYADDYQNLKARLEGLQSKLPRTADPGDWILDEVRKTLQEEGIVPLSISPPTDEKKGDYRYISIQVQCQGSYPSIASWISRLERNPSLLFIGDLTLKKDPEPIGSNTANVTITTLMPVAGGGG